MRSQILLVILALLMPVRSAAQAVDTTVQERKLDPVTVKLFDSTRHVRGGFLGLTSDGVTVMVDGIRVRVPLAQVRRVDVGGDSLVNGAVIGALAAALYCALICGQGLDSTDAIPAAVAMTAGAGALIGAGIDNAIGDRKTIYQARRPSGRGRTFRPAVGFTVRF